MEPVTACIILVEPQSRGNLGAVARVMHNFGFPWLRLVGAAPVKADYDLAVHSAEILDRAERFATLAAAIADLDRVVALSRRTGKHKRPDFDVRGLAAWRGEQGAARVGLVFGRERFGLTDQEAALCPLRCRIPTAASQPSLNLAQAVAVVCYELAMSVCALPAEPARLRDEELRAAAAETIACLQAIGYFKAKGPAQLRRFFEHFFAAGRLSRADARVFTRVFRRIVTVSGQRSPGASHTAGG